jgi:hypothetical protein
MAGEETEFPMDFNYEAHRKKAQSKRTRMSGQNTAQVQNPKAFRKKPAKKRGPRIRPPEWPEPTTPISARKQQHGGMRR